MTCPPTDQNKKCPNTSAFSNVRTYIGQDGCQYPCPSSDSINQDNIPESCLAKSSSQSAARFSVNEENSIQPQQQTTEPSQQDVQTTSSQNAFVNPGINIDSSSGVFNSELTTTQKSFNPAGKLRSGLGQIESSIPSLSYDPSRPKSSESGNAEVEGTPLAPPRQTESSIPSLSALKGPAFLTVYSNFTPPDIPRIAELCVYTSNPYEIKANPYCIEGSFDGTVP